MIYGNCVGGIGLERTYILVDEKGNEVAATLVDNETSFDATANDIRQGKVAATNSGVTVGTKEIPAYNTSQGRRTIKPGASLVIPMYSDKCQFTKFQAIICLYNTAVSDSLAAQLVAIEDKLYEVGSTAELATITVDVENQSINLGITNDGDTSLVIRYMTIKEET